MKNEGVKLFDGTIGDKIGMFCVMCLFLIGVFYSVNWFFDGSQWAYDKLTEEKPSLKSQIHQVIAEEKEKEKQAEIDKGLVEICASKRYWAIYDKDKLIECLKPIHGVKKDEVAEKIGIKTWVEFRIIDGKDVELFDGYQIFRKINNEWVREKTTESAPPCLPINTTCQIIRTTTKEYLK